MEVKVHKSLDAKKKSMAMKMSHRPFDSGHTNIKDKHGFIKNGTGFTASQSFHAK